MYSILRRHTAWAAVAAAFMACGCLLKQPPDPFALLSPEDGATGVEYRPTLAWSESAGAKTYSLWLSTEDGVFGEETLLVSDAPWTTSFELPEDLERGRTYWWRVEARNSDGRTACAEDCSFRIEFTVLHVDASAAGANDGSTWADAFTSIHDALDVSIPGDEVWVAAGTYRPTRLTDSLNARTATFSMAEGVGLYGGFAGGEVEFIQRDWQTNETVLCGDIGVADDGSDNAYHVVLGADDAVLDGFTVTNGNANGSGIYRYGGGMLNQECSPTVVNCYFSANGATFGGGICNRKNSPKIVSCVFSSNNAVWSGGGIDNFLGNPTITGCGFIGNTAGEGAGIYSYLSMVSASDCTYAENVAGGSGGGIYHSEFILTLERCTFTGNLAGANGGGIYVDSGKLSAILSGFTGNTAIADGGGIHSKKSIAMVQLCTFTDNVSENLGGGMYCIQGTLSVDSCSFVRNLAVNTGGGICTNEYTPSITNSTFVCNAAMTGGAIGDNDGDSIITSCLLWGNVAYAGSDVFQGNPLLRNLSYCLIEGCGGSGDEWDASLGIDGGGNISGLPNLMSLPLTADRVDEATTTTFTVSNAGICTHLVMLLKLVWTQCLAASRVSQTMWSRSLLLSMKWTGAAGSSSTGVRARRT